MKLSKITPVIITFNEEPNIKVLLDSLGDFPHVVVVDSGSVDATESLVRGYPNTTLLVRKFDDFARQWNYGVDYAKTDWILALDADYRVNGQVLQELQSIEDSTEVEGYIVPFNYAIFGRVLRCGIYPPRVIFFRKSKTRFVNDGHSQAIEPKGQVLSLKIPVIHDDWKDMGRWVKNQIAYAKMERDKLMGSRSKDLTLPDRFRLLFPLAPISMLVYILIIRRGILDGWPGVFYALQRVIAELIIGLFILEKKLANALGQNGDRGR